MEENKPDTNKLERNLIWIAFGSLVLQVIFFFIFKSSEDGVSSFGDFFGFSAAFFSALVIVLLIRELKEQRESRVKVETSLKKNAETLDSVKGFFESQSEYQSEQLKHIRIQSIDLSVERINRKYQNDLENVMFFKSKFIETKIKHKSNSSIRNLIHLINLKLDKNINSVVEVFEVFNLAYFRLEPFMNSLLNMLNKIEIDILNHSTTFSSMLEISGKDINELGLSEENIEIIRALANILITLNSILSTEEKLIFGIYLKVHERVYTDRKFQLSLLLYDEIYFESDNTLKVRRLIASHHSDSSIAIELIRKLENYEKQK